MPGTCFDAPNSGHMMHYRQKCARSLLQIFGAAIMGARPGSLAHMRGHKDGVLFGVAVRAISPVQFLGLAANAPRPLRLPVSAFNFAPLLFHV